MAQIGYSGTITIPPPVLNPAACIVLSGTGTCTDIETSATGGNPALPWLKVYTNGPVTTSGSPIQILVNGNGDASGVVSPGTIPVGVDFTVNNLGTTGWSYNYNVLFSLNGQSGGYNYVDLADFMQTASIMSGDTVTLTGNINVSSLTGIDGYTVLLGVSPVWQGMGPPPAPDPFSVTIPQNSLDFNVAGSAAPEPATSGMLATAALGLAALRLRRIRKDAGNAVRS